MLNALNKLSSTCNRAMQSGRTLNINKFDNLTVISASSGAGKNTLMKGIMYGYIPDENFVVLTESSEFSSGFHDLCRTMIAVYGDINIKEIVDKFEQTDCNNLFIEQYIRCGNKGTQFEDLNYLREYSKISGKQVFICVHLPRQKL